MNPNDPNQVNPNQQPASPQFAPNIPPVQPPIEPQATPPSVEPTAPLPQPDLSAPTVISPINPTSISEVMNSVITPLPPPPPAPANPSNTPDINTAALPQAQNPSLNNYSMPPSSSGRKPLLLIVAGVVTIGLVLAIVLILLSLLGNVSVKYGTSDLVKATSAHYSVSYPKQWIDETSNQSLVTKLGLSGTGLDDTKIYAYRVSKTNDYAQSIMMVGDHNLGVSDDSLRTNLQDPTARKQFTSDLTSSFNADSLGCKSENSQQSRVDYNNPNYVYILNIKFGCTPLASNAGKVLPVHVDVISFAKNGYVYVGIVLTLETDWKNNSVFYDKDLLPSLQAK